MVHGRAREYLADFDHLKVVLTHPAFGADKVPGDILPSGTRCDSFFRIAFGFVVNPTADNALPLPHDAGNPIDEALGSAVTY